MNNQLYVVSGCPRSGTSLMMDCLRVAIGEERMLGSKFPMQRRRQELLKKKDDETNAEHKWRKYINDHLDPDQDEKIKRSMDLNPNGFFEHEHFSVRGIWYNSLTRDLIKKIRAAENPYFCKIVSQGLSNSNPEMIKKIIFMLRDPYSVAKSQERLMRNGKFTLQNGRTIDIYKDAKINTPEMFISVTLSATKWILDNSEIDIHYVKYDDLVSDPLNVLLKVKDFLGEGDFEEASKIINPKLKRSEPQKGPNNLWDDADIVYDMFKNGEYNDLLNIFTDKKREINRQNNNWLCVRYGESTSEAYCKTCKKSKEFRDSLKIHAQMKGIDWTDKPCAYECAYDLDNPKISIKESIESNFWMNE